MKRLIFRLTMLCMIAASVSSCSKDERTNTIPSGVFLNNYATFRITLADGSDFFTQQYVDQNNIKVLKLVDGNYVEANNLFSFYIDPDGKANFKINLSEPVVGDNFTTVVKWNDTDHDTFTYGYIIFPNGSVSINDLKVNGERPVEFGQYASFILHRDYADRN